MKNLLLSVFMIMVCVTISLAQTSLQGKVTDGESGELLPFTNIELLRNDVQITGTQTDFDGNYILSNIEPGTYDVKVSFVGYNDTKIQDVIVKAGKTNQLDIQLSSGVLLEDVVIVDYRAPLIEIDNTTSGTTVTAEKIKSLPTKSVVGIAATSAGLSANENGDVSIRGSRTDATFYYIDGVRVSSRDALIPQSEIDQLQVITGGIEARYGDVTGGVISITSKGPSNNYSGGVEIETSKFLDDAGYLLGSANVSGPIWKKNDKSIIGFRFSGQYRSVDDDSPSAIGVYRLGEDKIRELEENPVMDFRGTQITTGETLQDSDIEAPLGTRPNQWNKDLSLTGKIDARLTDNMDISISGSYRDNDSRFLPAASTTSSGNNGGGWSLLNWPNNPYSYNNSYRVNARFRHKIGNQGATLVDGQEQASVSPIQNAFYSLQVGYERSQSKTEDARHEDRLFDYGYIGSTERSFIPFASEISDTSTYEGEMIPFEIIANGVVVDTAGFFGHQGANEMVGEFTPDANINPVLAKYNTFNGRMNETAESVWGFFSNVGQVYNRNTKTEQDRYTVNVNAGFDFLPGGSEKGRHNIQLGFTYEQRNLRSYLIAPFTLWELSRSLANELNGVDYNIPIIENGDTLRFSQTLTTPDGLFSLDTTFVQYQSAIDVENLDNKFYRAIRDKLGLGLFDFVNTDGVNPSDLSLDMFSAFELINQGLVSYYGYDYLGNKLPASVKFDDFFTSVDSEGRRTFEVGSIQPIYGAAYIQDKFSYKDIIFRLGVRLDYFDANTKVLKDPYALYEIETAEQFYGRTGQEQPVSVSDNYKVYVSDDESDNIIGFRDGDQWFSSNGTSVSDGNVLFNGGLVFPSYVGKDGTRNLNIQAPLQFDSNGNPSETNYKVEYSFEDYEPQINIMPRLAFSFPISEDANFFAHYDVLVQRPGSGNIATARDYFFFNDPNRTPLNNPNLKPEKTIDYEVGFQQKLSSNSALKLSAYYKELRDMIQRRFYLYVPAPVNQYESIGNLDFGTVKGFSMTYDRRRSNNLEFSVTYTLQFADGTGSDVNSSDGLNTRGNIRNLLPLDYDERHRFTAVVDYRYRSGKKYNGPRIGGLDILANMGVNFIATAVSGRPFNRLSQPSEFSGSGYTGSLNGSRLPWQFDVDARIDKSFSIKLSEDSKRNLNFNVYLRVSNLFNIKNTVNVYPVTGDPDDDGFLVSSFGLDAQELVLQRGQDLNSYLATYQWRLAAPGNYTQPRRLYLGAIFDF